MAKKELRSFRLDGRTAGLISDASGQLGVSQADVVALAVSAFTMFGFADALAGVRDLRGGDYASYVAALELARPSQGIQNRVHKLIGGLGQD